MAITVLWQRKVAKGKTTSFGSVLCLENCYVVFSLAGIACLQCLNHNRTLAVGMECCSCTPVLLNACFFYSTASKHDGIGGTLNR